MTTVLSTPASLDDSTAPGVDLGPAVALSCRECGHRIDARTVLRVYRVLRSARGRLRVRRCPARPSRDAIEAGPEQHLALRAAAAGPVDVAQTRNMNPGSTKLIRADNLARELGMKTLWVKDDSGNPTHSFKDRVVAVALAAARELGLLGAGLPVHRQPGQRRRRRRRQGRHPLGGARSRATSSSRRSSPPPPTAAPWSPSRATTTTSTGWPAQIAAEQEDWAFVNVNVRPYYAEGSKTLGFEVAEQLGWRLPQQLVIPIASGAQLVKIDKGFTELGELGLVEPTPYKVFGAQATGCSPVSAAFKAGEDTVRPVRPDTIAKSLAIGNPADGPYVLDVTRRTGGAVEDVSDDEVIDGIQLLARTEGIFAETAGGVTVARAAQAARDRSARPRGRDRDLQHR